MLDDIDAGFAVGDETQPQPGAVNDPLSSQRQRRLERGAIHPAQRPAAPRAGRQRCLPRARSRRALTKSTSAASCTDTGASASSTTPILVTPAITATSTRSGSGWRCWCDPVRSPAAARSSPGQRPRCREPAGKFCGQFHECQLGAFAQRREVQRVRITQVGIPGDRFDRAHPLTHRLVDMADELLVRLRWVSLSTITERLSSSWPRRAASQSTVVSTASPPSALHDPTIINASEADQHRLEDFVFPSPRSPPGTVDKSCVCGRGCRRTSSCRSRTRRPRSGGRPTPRAPACSVRCTAVSSGGSPASSSAKNSRTVVVVLGSTNRPSPP